jgi:hypothetical protein
MAAHGRRLFFFSSCLTDIPAPLVSGAPFTFLSSSPSSTSSGPAPPWSPPRPTAPFPCPPLHLLAFQIRSFPFPPLLPEMSAAFNGKRRPPLAPFASPLFPLSWLLFKVEPELLLAPLLSHCKHTRLSIPFTIVAASVRPSPPCHRHRRWRTTPSTLFPFSFGSPGAHRACPIAGWWPRAFPEPVRGSPERRPIRRHRRSSSPARFLRIQARPTPLHAVSIFTHPILFLLVLTVARTTSPEQPRRPLPAPAVVEARTPSLTPLSCARVTSLHFAPARDHFGAP